MTVLPVRIVHLTIEREPEAVYAFASDPRNMPKWASGLSAGLEPDGEDWVGDGGPIGKVRVRFAPPNPFGVIDHTVTMPDGQSVHNALRVTPNGDGSLVSFILLRRPEMDNAAFEADAAHVRMDLMTLRALMEAGR